MYCFGFEKMKLSKKREFRMSDFRGILMVDLE